MPYHSATAVTTGTPAFLVSLKDFLTGTVGWTLHDDGSADPYPYYVFKSFGESGAEDLYLRFQNDSGANRISVEAYQYWNATTHTGVNGAYYLSNTYTRTSDTAQFIYWFFADLDHVFIVTKIGTIYYGHYSGVVRRFWSDAIAVTQAAATAGSNVVLPVNTALIFTVGEYYLIKDNAGIERVKVTAVNTSVTPNTVTVQTLTKGYAAGAKIGEDPQPVINGHFNSPGVFYALNRFDGYSSANGHVGRCGAANGGLQTDCDPDFRYGRTVLFPWLASLNASDCQELRGELIEVYSFGGGNTDCEDTLTVGSDTYLAFNLSGVGWCAVKG